MILKGSIVNLFSQEIAVEAAQIALDGFRKVYYLKNSPDSCSYLPGTYEKKAADQPGRNAIPYPEHFDALVRFPDKPPMTQFNSGGPYSKFINIYGLGFIGLLNNNFALFAPPHVTPVNPEVDSDNNIAWWNLLAQRTKDDWYSLSPPTFYIVSRRAVIQLQDHKYGADPRYYLIPVKLKETDDFFAGFIPASYLMLSEREEFIAMVQDEREKTAKPQVNTN